MDFLHYDFKLRAGDEIKIMLDHQADVRLMDDANYALFKGRAKYAFVGGHASKSPASIVAPSDGHWNLVIVARDHASELHVTVEVRPKH